MSVPTSTAGIKVSFSAPSSKGSRVVRINGENRSVVEKFIGSFRGNLQECDSTRNSEGSAVFYLSESNYARGFNFKCLVEDSSAYRVFLREKLGVSEDDIQRNENDYQNQLKREQIESTTTTTTEA